MFWAARALHWCIQRVLPWPRGLGNLLNLHRDRDRLLQLLILNEEFLVNAVHQTALITSLPFVHTARRTYRLIGPVKPRDCGYVPLLGRIFRNLSKPYQLEEGEVVTRFLLVNQQKDHYYTRSKPLKTVNCPVSWVYKHMDSFQDPIYTPWYSSLEHRAWYANRLECVERCYLVLSTHEIFSNAKSD